MAESYEVSPDKLTVTMKLRQGQKWDARAPTNGRVMDMEDVMFSWNKFAKVNPAAANFVNARNPAAPVESIAATDPRTLVIKLKRPDATTLPLFASTDGFYIMPKEADGGFDPATDVRGNGPWQLEEYMPSVRFVWRRNPDYYVKDRPFPDTLERPIITETAQRLAQFRAGNIHTDIVNNAQESVLQLKKDTPKAVLYLPELLADRPTPSIWFGYEGNSPFKDARVRQAFSMLVDREAFDIAINNADMFKAEGLGRQRRGQHRRHRPAGARTGSTRRARTSARTPSTSSSTWRGQEAAAGGRQCQRPRPTCSSTASRPTAPPTTAPSTCSPAMFRDGGAKIEQTPVRLHRVPQQLLLRLPLRRVDAGRRRATRRATTASRFRPSGRTRAPST